MTQAGMSADGLPPLREIIRAHGLSARKSLGQNFILDLNLTRRIARAAGPLNGRTVVEIGPGPGGLTRALLSEGCEALLVIERDERCLAALAEIAAHYPGRLTVIAGDATAIDIAGRIQGPASIVANLPYSVATVLLIGWLTAEPWPPWFDRMTLMFQREVADRLVATPGNRSYGRLSVLAQWRCAAKVLFNLPPEAFTPAPKVASTLVQFVPRSNPDPTCRTATLERLTGAAFGQRRKMLRASLKQIIPHPEPLLERIGVRPELRAEDLTVAQFAALAAALDSAAR